MQQDNTRRYKTCKYHSESSQGFKGPPKCSLKFVNTGDHSGRCTLRDWFCATTKFQASVHQPATEQKTCRVIWSLEWRWLKQHPTVLWNTWGESKMTWNPATSDGILNPWGCFVHDSVVKTCSVSIISYTPMVVAASPKASYTKTGQGVATLMHWRRQCPEISNCPGLGKKSAQYSLSCKPCQCHGNARMHNANAQMQNRIISGTETIRRKSCQTTGGVCKC